MLFPQTVFRRSFVWKQEKEKKTEWFGISVNRAGKFFFDSDTTPCFTVFVDGSSELFQKVLECFHSHQDARELIGIDWESPWKSALSFVEIVEILTSYAKSNFDEVCKPAFFKALSQCQRFISRSEIHLLLASLRNVETGEFLVDPLGDYGLWTDYARDCTLFGMLLKAVTLKYLLRDSSIYFFSVDKFKDALKDIGNPISEFTAFFKTAHYDQVWGDDLDANAGESTFHQMQFFLRDLEVYSRKATKQSKPSTPQSMGAQRVFITPRFQKSSSGVAEVRNPICTSLKPKSVRKNSEHILNIKNV